MKSNRYWYNNGRIDNVDSSREISMVLTGNRQGLYACWRTSGSRIPFYDGQYRILAERISGKMGTKPELPEKEYLKSEIKSLLHRNRIFKGALVHIYLIPPAEDEKVNYPGLFILSEEYRDEKYVMNVKGLIMDHLEGFVHPGVPGLDLNELGHPAFQPWGREKGIWYFTNKKGKIVELNNASLFLVKGTRLYTPSEAMGLYPRAIRDQILGNSGQAGLSFTETENLESKHLLAADEIFAANDMFGVKWIGGYKIKRFVKNYSIIFQNILNREWALAD